MKGNPFDASRLNKPYMDSFQVSNLSFLILAENSSRLMAFLITEWREKSVCERRF